MKKKVSLDDLTLGEVAQLEAQTGIPIDKMTGEDSPKMPLMIGLAWIARRREHPLFTYNQAEAMTFGELSDFVDVGGDEDDDEPGHDPEV